MISPRMLLASGVLVLAALAQEVPSLPAAPEDAKGEKSEMAPVAPVSPEKGGMDKPRPSFSKDRGKGREFGEKGAPSDCQPPVSTPRPWLGVNLERLDESARAQLGDLPHGVGLAVESIVENGPAAKAGIQPFDVLWRWEDQLLINEAQLRVLLRMRKAGDTVRFSVFRGGKDQVLTVTLAEQPGERPLNLPPGVAWDPTMDSGQASVPIRVIDRGARSAKLETVHGVAELTMENNVPLVTIKRSDGTEWFRGPIGKPEEFAELPQEWKWQVLALRRAMDRAMGEEIVPRKPRMRIIPAPKPPEQVTQPEVAPVPVPDPAPVAEPKG